MGILSKILGGGAMEAAGSIASTIADYKTGKLDHQAAMAQLEAGQAAFQIQVNMAEAAHPNVFVAGWRPAVGWVCVIGLAYTFLVQPLVNGTFGTDRWPDIPVEQLMILLGGLLGLGGMRTWEKLKDKARN